MARNIYEGMFLLDSGKTSGSWDAAAKVVHGILERHQAEIVASRPWDDRRLSYPVKGHKKGMYLLTYFKVEGANLTKIDLDCRINETILRQLMLKVPTKLADAMVAQAMAPHEPPPPPATVDDEVDVLKGIEPIPEEELQ